MNNLKQIIEAILFVSGDAVAYEDISDKLNMDIEEVKAAVEELKKDKEQSESGVQVVIFNNKAQLASNKQYVNEITEVLNPIRERALTRAVLEVCAIVAYKQPITRMEIEAIRESKNCDYAVNALLENNLIEVVGRKDTVGKPLQFGTTDTFLKKFGLTSIGDLPDYEELLDRIKVLHESYSKKDESLFNFNNIPQDLEKEEVEMASEASISTMSDEEVLDNLSNVANEEIFQLDDDDDIKFV